MRSSCSLSVCLSVCLYVYPPYRLLNAWTNLYGRRYVRLHHTTCTYLNSTLHKSLLSVCVSVCVSPPSLPVKGSVNTFPRQRIHATIKKLDASFSMRSVPYHRRECLPLSLLGKSSVNMFPQQWIIVGGSVFCVVHVVSKESRPLPLPKTTCSHLIQ
jgi:hypothetical protein